VICDVGDIVVLPFPFVDIAAEKRRPSLILSRQEFNRANGHAICAMVTTAGRTQWPSDVEIADLKAAGLPRPCVVRFKLFTLPNVMILRRVGSLAQSDRQQVFTAAQTVFL
jgi:mRNA-degrading endonuclease toxin of MazEF toxin-antitoxin module